MLKTVFAIGGFLSVRASLPCDNVGRTYTSCDVGWISGGPSGTASQGATSKNVGAVQQVVEGPPGVWFAASVNGGVWRTTNISVKSPHWEPVTDGQPVTCSSMSAVSRHLDDHRIIYAGCGASTSGEEGDDVFVTNSGDWGGVMVSRDGGDSWNMTSFPENWYVTSIASMGGSNLAVSAAAHFVDAAEGGVWISPDDGVTWEKTLSLGRAFDLKYHADYRTLVAVITDADDEEDGVQLSRDGGKTWASWGEGLKWSGRRSFYSTLDISPTASGAIVFLGVYARDVSHLANTTSGVFWRPLLSSIDWQLVQNSPTNLDGDSMPKDRMGVMADPTNPDLIYVSGNGGSFAWRVEWKTGKWHDLVEDTADGNGAHGDCRTWAWDQKSNGAVLTSDGGVFMRSKPGSPGGKWRSLNGDMRQMELLDARWDARQERWIAGAQDNCVQLSPPGAVGDAQSLCFLGGDGTAVEVDNVHNPSRLFGATQFLGLGADDDDETEASIELGIVHGDCEGAFCFIQGTPGIDQIAVNLPLDEWGFRNSAFPYFVADFHLNSQNTSQVLFWARAFPQKPESKSGWHMIEIPEDARSSRDIREPKLVLSSEDATIFSFIAGGTTGGESDHSLIVGVNNTHLHHRSKGGSIELRKLPVKFATPVQLQDDAHGDPILGPITHGKTVFLAVSPSDSSVLAVTGWTNIKDNSGTAGIWLSRDAGETWKNVVGNLVESTGTVGQPRPSGIHFVDFPELNSSALLTGTVSGVFISWIDGDHVGRWSRLGTCNSLPLVLVMGISYEPYSDVLLASTYGRGVYILKNAKQALAKSRAQQEAGSCEVAMSWTPSSSVGYYPSQVSNIEVV